ncbi:MAG: polyprenyl synthetase family protein [Deltaproteobacteria bacterium]|nr:polyprenyl synthetase family protein [Deltaproteobacteria bacterium]
MKIDEVVRHYEKDLDAVKQFIQRELELYVSPFADVTRHIIAGGGKRLRPLLVIISMDLCGLRTEKSSSPAAVIEFIHTASLLHDDVLDHASLRRGRKSANRIWGNQTSILVGDYLYSRAFELIVNCMSPAVQRLMARATMSMVEGETIQLVKSSHIGISEEEYLGIIEKKTAVLMSAACAAGAMLAGAPQERVDALGYFGAEIGLAFQLTDDTLDYMAEESVFGKSPGMDLKEGKITLPLIRAYGCADPPEQSLLETLVLKGGAISMEDLAAVNALINKYQGIDYALAKARDHVEKATKALAGFEESLPKEALFSIARHVVERQR